MLSPRKPLRFHHPTWCSPIPCHSFPCHAATGPHCSHLPTLNAGTFRTPAGILWCLENHFHEPALALLTQPQPSRPPEHLAPPSCLSSLLPAPHSTWVAGSEPISQLCTPAVGDSPPKAQGSPLNSLHPSRWDTTQPHKALGNEVLCEMSA